MKFILVLFLILPSLGMASVTLVDEIHSLSLDNSLIKFTSGRVAFYNNSMKSVSDLHSLIGKKVEISLSEDHDLLSLSEIKATSKTSNFLTSQDNYKFLSLDLRPTIFKNKNEVNRLFDRLNNTYKKESQCYNRAHIWVYEEYTAQNNVLNKAFVFFSDNYIKTHKFKWWFHVAPYVLYKDSQEIYSAVLDHQFASAPLSFKNWTDTWIESKYPCRPIAKYSDFSSNIYQDECFLMKVNMFYWQPRDIENLEKLNSEKNAFFMNEIEWAYAEAFTPNN